MKPDGLLIFDCFNGLTVIKQGAKQTYKGRLIKETDNWIYRSGIPKIDMTDSTELFMNTAALSCFFKLCSINAFASEFAAFSISIYVNLLF